MHPERSIVLFAAMILFLFSCSDVFEKDLKKDSVTLQSPPDNYTGTVLNQYFWWDEVKGATKYQLQLAKPNFDNLSQLVLDTTLISNKYIYTLTPGSYCWRVRAQNTSSNTEYAVRCLRIDSTPNLASQQLVLSSPADNYATKLTTLSFRWYRLVNSNDYRFELHTPVFSGQLVSNPVIITDTFYNVTTALAEGTYFWGVRGQNTFSNTQFSTRSFIVDTTKPNVPVLLTPALNDSVTKSSISFTWNRGTETGSAISDSMVIFTDSTALSVKAWYYTSTPSKTVDSLAIGKYYWRVSSIDAAGNNSGYTALRRFYVK